MCGIVAILGQNEAAPILMEALRRLEYRGYDSAGISTLYNGKLQRQREVGKLAVLSNLLVREPIRGRVGIGHTRWATHGPATIVNAHPHHGRTVAVVHNGIIENFREIRKKLADDQIQTSSETDTETVVLLCQHFLDQGLTPIESVKKTISQLKGSFALVFLFEGEEETLIAARRQSPLIVGYGENEVYLASDEIALAGLVKRVSHLHDKDLVHITREKTHIIDGGDNSVERDREAISIDLTRISKGGHKHFMAKEIYEQPKTLGRAIDKFQTNGALLQPESVVNELAKAERVELVGCGTANYACQVAGYWFESLAGIPASCTIASEFASRHRSPAPSTFGVFVSQSGETADTLTALRHLSQHHCKSLAILNVLTSTMSREADYVIPIDAGVEVSVASTKAFTSQLNILAALAISTGYVRGHIDQERFQQLLTELTRLPGLVSVALNNDDAIKSIAKAMGHSTSVLFIGRGTMFPLALEGALKLKEISYIHAEGMASGELKHGPLALVDDNMHVVVLAPSGKLFPKIVSNTEEVKARGGKVLFISDSKGAEAAASGVWKAIRMPDIDPILAPILYAVPLQLLAYHIAVHLGTDVDQPRNLAKSVTVE